MKGRWNEACSCDGGCDCGCCEGVEPLTPQPIANRPGLDAIACRIGTHSSFLETMKARLSSQKLPALAPLTTRDANDFSIALLDAWAVVADVLTFYQERVANEGYLRTATERRSVLELARLVGYAPRPGVSASTHLAYTLEEKVKPAIAPGSPVTPVSTSLDEPEVVIPAGSRSQSVPGPGEKPQFFETSEDLTARAAWNKLQVRLTRPQQPGKLTMAKGLLKWPVVVYFKGIATNLKPNDPLLIATDLKRDPELYRALKVDADVAKDRTRVEIEPWLKEETPQPTVTPAVPHISIQGLQEILARASDLEARGIRRGPTAEKVLQHLEPLKTALTQQPDEARLRTVLQEALPELRQDRLGVERSRRLEPWIRGLVEELESVETTSAPAAGAGITSLPDVLGSFAKQPNPQPSNRLHLDRDVKALASPESDLNARLLTVARPELREVLYKAWANVPVVEAPALKVYALRTRASVFGHNAPMERPFEDGHLKPPLEWTLTKTVVINGEQTTGPTEEKDVIWLDAAYPQVLPEGWIVLQRPNTNVVPQLVITHVKKSSEQSRAEYGVSAKATRLRLASDWLNLTGNTPDDFNIIRGTAVFAQSEELTLAEEPIEEPIHDEEIELSDLYDGLDPGRWLIVTGERSDVEGDATGPEATKKVRVPGVPAAELAMLAGVRQDVQKITRKSVDGNQGGDITLPGERVHTILLLAKPLAYRYKRDTVTVYGNVAHATHGETRSEVLGSGDASKALQSFTLKQPPLTWISAPTPSGIDSTLNVRVNDVRWHLAGSLAEMGPADRSYILRTDDGGQTTVVFGNGEQGARLPTGSENARATYRSGIGKGGNVQAGQISQLATRPLGVKDVINPLPATGGADRESRDQARRNAPLAVMALDRLISVQDYADFARTFAGVGKASAARLTDGRSQRAQVTIAGEDDVPIAVDSDLFRNLAAALRRFGDAREPLQLVVRERTFLIVQAEVRRLPDFFWDAVEPKIRAALLDAFGFQSRDLAQDALLSEIYSVIQGVRGVDLVDVNVFARKNPEDLSGKLDQGNATADLPASRLPAHPDRVDEDGELQPAQLLYLTPEVADTLILKERKS